ncbi:MAG TPA: GntR family transcriptional regulator [Pseudolabrys sp.]|nr:GntR family transcriptional regulator [Pseudolabrys sp.]
MTQPKRNATSPKADLRPNPFDATAKRRRGEGLGDFAARVLRDGIRGGSLPPGEHLREADVARWLNISRTPVREAFHRIVSEGLLVTGPWNGAMVIELDQQRLVELYAVREVLEGSAASLASQHASKAEIQNLFRIAESEEEARNDPDRLVLINAELHQAIYSATHNRYLLQSLNAIADTLGLLRHSTFVISGSAEQARKEHLDILRAIRDGNAVKAEKAARIHVSNALAFRLELLRRTAQTR